MRALDRKVLRDLRLLWSQAITIALVVASGIGGFLATLSAVDSLAQARDDSVLLLGELALGIAIALPLGMLLGWSLTHGVVQLMRSDQFLFPVVIQPRTYAWSAICVVAAGVASAMVVRRRIDRLDMVAALKTRE